MKRERARATEASRARAAAAAEAAAAAAAAGKSGAVSGVEHHGTSQEDRTGYRASEPNGTGYQAKGLQRGDVGDGVRAGRDVTQQHHPSPPPAQQVRDGAAAGGVHGAGGRGRGAGGGRRRGRLGGAERYQGGRYGQPPNGKKHRPTNAAGGGEDVHALYEERLAKLERRLGEAGKQAHRQGQQRPPEESPKPRPAGGGGGEEWGAENNPFGFRKLSAAEDEGGCGSMPSSSSGRRGLSRWGSETSGGEDVEGLSTMYMGPIAHKMAELRAGNG